MGVMILFLSRAFSVILFFICSFSFAQSKKITGSVRGEDGSLLAGVNVTEKGTSNGTVSDAEGKFAIAVTENAVLVFSFVGFATLEVKVNQETTLDVTLKLDEIYCGPSVSVGYGFMDQNKIPFAVSRIESSDFNQGNIYESAQLWQGKIPGLSIYHRGGDPNVESFMRIRGMTSFDTKSKPLIVIDGVPAATLNNIDPNDVASISVLKDGASAAIYGMRGSAGVIEITTKRGSPGVGLSVTYHGNLSVSEMQRKQPLLSAAEFVAVGGANIGFRTDWQDEITRTAFSTLNSISVGGGNEQSTFRASLNFREVNGILLHSGFDQMNGRANFTHRAFNDLLRMEFNMSFTNRASNFSFPEAFRFIHFNPTAPIKFPSGDYFQAIQFDNYNPVALLELNTNEGKRKNINYNFKTSYEISENITATIQYAQQFEDVLNGAYFSRKDFYRGLARGGLAQRYIEQSAFNLVESYLSFHKRFQKNDLTIVAGYSYQQDRSENIGIELGNFPSDDLGYQALENSGDRISGAAGLVNVNSNTSPLNKLSAGFARLLLNHADIWQLNFSLRREASSKLGSNNKAGTFSSIAFDADLNRLWSLNVSILKARIGYGITGALPSRYSLSKDLFAYSLYNGGTIRQAQGANPDLKWEQKNEVNLGFDFGFGRFNGSLDLYKRKTKNIIQEQYESEFDYYRYLNSGRLKGRGVELSLQYFVGNYGELNWRPSLVISANRTLLNRNPVDKQLKGWVDGLSGANPIRLAVGEKVGQFWAPVFSGVNTNGAPIFKDVNGDGQVRAYPGEALSPVTDFAVAGNAIPWLELGWNNQLKFRRWDFNAFFRGSFGHSLLNTRRLLHEPNDAGSINNYNQIRTSKAVHGITSGYYSSLYIEKANFLKMDNVTLGYTIKTPNNSKLFMFRMFVTIQNAFVITNYTGADPEPVFIDRVNIPYYFPTEDALAPGIDRKASYFPARTFTLGLSLGL